MCVCGRAAGRVSGALADDHAPQTGKTEKSPQVLFCLLEALSSIRGRSQRFRYLFWYHRATGLPWGVCERAHVRG